MLEHSNLVSASSSGVCGGWYRERAESLGLAKGSPCKVSSDQAISEHGRGE